MSLVTPSRARAAVTAAPAVAIAEPVAAPDATGRLRRAAGGAGARALAPVAILTAIALSAPLLAPTDPTAISAVGSLQAPSASAPLGTDEVGRDVLSRVLHGIRASWLAALAVIAGGALLGGLIGLLAGAGGRLVDTVLMRITDLFLALPAPILAIAVIAALGPSLRNSLLALSVVWWPWYARIVRGEVRALAGRPHVEAARMAGVGRVRLMLRHLLPAALPPVIVTMSLDVGNLILALAGLSFIGLGAPPPSPELGAMSARGLQYLFGHPWIPLAPALAVAVLAFAANVAGDSINRRLNPSQRTSR
jgi:peptide/nickel transport system permease protein